MWSGRGHVCIGYAQGLYTGIIRHPRSNASPPTKHAPRLCPPCPSIDHRSQISYSSTVTDSRIRHCRIPKWQLMLSIHHPPEPLPAPASYHTQSIPNGGTHQDPSQTPGHLVYQRRRRSTQNWDYSRSSCSRAVSSGIAKTADGSKCVFKGSWTIAVRCKTFINLTSSAYLLGEANSLEDGQVAYPASLLASAEVKTSQWNKSVSMPALALRAARIAALWGQPGLCTGTVHVRRGLSRASALSARGKSPDIGQRMIRQNTHSAFS